MGDHSKIEWTEATWNALRGCSRVSEGCRHCYAEQVAGTRLAYPGAPYEGLTTLSKKGEPRWTGEVRFVPHLLDQPMRWSKSRRIFVNSMSDVFHEEVSDETIALLFCAMAVAPQHVYQLLTKRSRRMREWFAKVEEGKEKHPQLPMARLMEMAMAHTHPRSPTIDSKDPIQRVLTWYARHSVHEVSWPLKSVWLGVSAEDATTADERVHDLDYCSAEVKWVSYEPALGPVASWAGLTGQDGPPQIDWVVVGGESGKAARPFNLDWARRTIEDGKRHGYPVFVKQLGSDPYSPQMEEGVPMYGKREDGSYGLRLADKKGGDWDEWPMDLRVREYPEART